MRRHFVLAAAAAITLLLPLGAAHAAKPPTPTSPGVSLQTCSKLGGTFSQSLGTKYCTYTATTTETVTSTLAEEVGDDPARHDFWTLDYTATSTYTQKITLIQKNNGLVVTQAEPKVLVGTVYTANSCSRTLGWEDDPGSWVTTDEALDTPVCVLFFESVQS